VTTKGSKLRSITSPAGGAALELNVSGVLIAAETTVVRSSREIADAGGISSTGPNDL
jgi:hypothetical protein